MSKKHHSQDKHIKKISKEKYEEADEKKCDKEADEKKCYKEADEKKCYKEDYSEEVKKEIKPCRAFVESETLPVCHSISKVPVVIKEPVIIKVPVVIAEPCVTIPIISALKLEDSACEIKRIGKNVYLSECKLMPNSGEDDPDFGMLFISGFVRKSIEYATKECINKTEFSGKLKHSTVKVDFNCASRIKFINKPIFTNNVHQNEIEIVESSNISLDSCKDSDSNVTSVEQSFKITEFFNEKVFCELVSAEISETDIIEASTNESCKLPIKSPFCNINEKVILHLTIKLLQNQQIKIP